MAVVGRVRAWFVWATASALLVAGCDGGSSAPADRPPSSSPTDAPTSAEVEEASILPMGGFPTGIPLEPGPYRPNPGFDIPFVVELGEGWRSIRDDSIGVVSLVTDATNGIGHATHWLSFFPAPPDVAPADLLARIETQDQIVPGRQREVSIGGVVGTQVDAAAEANPDMEGDAEVAPGTVLVGVANDLIFGQFWFSESPRARFRFSVLDVSGRTLLIYVEAPAADFDEFTAEVSDVLAGLSFQV